MSGAVIESELELAAMEPMPASARDPTTDPMGDQVGDPAPAGVRVEIGRGPIPPAQVLREQHPDLDIHEVAGGWRFDFSDLSVVLVEPGEPGAVPTVRVWPGEATAERVSHVVLDMFVPYALGLLGVPVLHGTAVFERGGAIGFLGSSGSGKSTTAMAFTRDGARFMADDCLVIDVRGAEPLLLPSYPGTRLLPDAHAGLLAGSDAGPGASAPSDGWKLRVGAGVAFVARREPAPVSGLFVLRPDRDVARPEAVAHGPARACVELIHQRLTLDVGADVHRDLLERFGTLAAAVPVWTLRFAPGLDGLDAVVALVRATLAERPDPARPGPTRTA
jgi:hypothetical protein